MEELKATLRRIDGRGYKAYKDLQGQRYSFAGYRLIVDHVQGDPYAAPSRLRVRVPLDVARIPSAALKNPARQRATRDFLARAFRAAAFSEPALAIDAGHQTVLDRSACLIADAAVELRFTANLPAAGRRILGRAAWTLLGERLPPMVDAATLARQRDCDGLAAHWAAVEDQVVLREALATAGLVAFIADGSVLPRRSGIDERPSDDGIALAAPQSLRVSLTAPNAGTVSGLGFPRGITLIVGGGFHGKSTLLRALQAGIYDHIPGDGRDQVVSLATATKIRAEDGRAVSGVDISAFIGPLPYRQLTTSFSSELASGSTSQAAALVESLEAEAELLLVDEDTSATNFMIRDRRMQALVASGQEPITPFIDRIREVRDTLGVSTVLVMGGSGDYFDHADTVIRMNAYQPTDVTSLAAEIATTYATGRQEEHDGALRLGVPRRLDPRSLQPESKPGRRKIQARGLDILLFGRSAVDLAAVEQLVDPSQIRAIGWVLAGMAELRSRTTEPIPEIEKILARLQAGDWKSLNGHPDGDFALPRPQEVMATLNRVRGVILDPALEAANS